MSKVIWWLIVILGCGLLATILYFALPQTKPGPVAQPTAPAPPAAPAEPQIRYPVTPQPAEKPLPALDASDSTMKNALGELLSEKTLIDLFQLQDFVRRIVATVDNLPREKVALQRMPVKRVGGKFLVTGRDDSLAVGADNAARYALYVRLAEATDAGKLVALYLHFYPLFQQAYLDLGYPKGYFNDRLIDVIDHLLAAPEVQAPVRLVQPKVFYLFADSDLEARSAGQKILMRVGGENAAKIKAKLREIRDELTRQGSKQ